MSNYMKGANSERDVVNRLVDEGWAANRIAGSGTASYDTADIWAFKGNVLLLMDVKNVGDKSNLPVKVKDSSDQLLSLMEKSNDDLYVDAAIVVDFDWLDSIRFATTPVVSIRSDDRLPMFYKLLTGWGFE